MNDIKKDIFKYFDFIFTLFVIILVGLILKKYFFDNFDTENTYTIIVFMAMLGSNIITATFISTVFKKHEESLGENFMINLVSLDQVDFFRQRIKINSGVIKRLFITYDYESKKFITIDDTSGDFFVEEFERIDEAIKWLNSER